MEVKPFKAFRYDRNVVGDTGSCIAPPYDIIDPDQQQRLYEKSRYNIVRIIKGKTSPSDDENNNQYTRAANYLNDWIEKGALKCDPAEAIYGYVQDFELAGVQLQRLSFIALARLEEFGTIVKPHEQILNEPIVDRLHLKRATGAKFGLVFMLYEDGHAIADKIVEKSASQEPLIDFVDEQDVRHRLFAITDKNDIEAITNMMSDKSCIIADGHHRYTTGLIYSKENPNPAAKYQMLACCNVLHDGLVVLATHRLVGNIGNFNADKLLAEMKKGFEIIEFPFDSPQNKADAEQKMLDRIKAEHELDKNAFGIYTGGSAFYAAILKDEKAMDSVAPDMSAAWRCLDVSVLHKLILEKMLGIDQEKLAKQSNVEYVKDTSNAVKNSIEKVDKGQKQAAFFMNPPKIRQIQLVTDQGERMPQKSTYFYPKIYTGLTINKL